jgi:hypothetical protein
MTRTKSSFLPIVLLGLMVLLAPALFGQANSASIVGTVTDPTGASISGATVTVVRLETGLKQTTVTNTSGNYNLPFLPVGNYSLSASFTGFQTVQIEQFQLVVGQTARMDIQMKVGQVSEKVSVEASAIALQTENGTVGTVIDREQVAELPLNGRSFVQLALLTPGVNPATPGSLSARSSGGSLGQQVGMSANGARDNQNRFYYDGVEAMSLGSYSMSFSLSIDAIREFKVDSSSYSAAYGAAPGGHVNLTTKSGTNEYHGQAWLFNRNDALTTLAPFQPYSTTAKPPRLNRNQFGANIGGPVVLPKIYNGKERTFFFFNWESGRLISGSFGGTAFVPPTAYRTGNFSGSAAVIYDPTTGQPFSNNAIPASRIQPYASKFLTYVPSPNTNEAAINFRGPNASAPTDQNQYLGRIDHRISDKNTLYGTYIFNQQMGYSVPTYGWEYTVSRGRQQVFALCDTHVFSASTVNELRLGWSRRRPESYYGTSYKPEYDIANIIGIAGVSKDPRDYGPPAFGMGYDAPAIAATNGPAYQHNQVWQFGDNLSINKGTHFLTMGALIYRRNFSFDEALNPRGTFTFDGRTTTLGGATPARENTFAAYLLGMATGGAVSPNPFANRMDHTWQSYYAQDDWKVTRNLTLNLGLRYDYFAQPVERGKVTNFELNGAIPGFTVSRQLFRNFPDIPDTPGVSPSLMNSDRNNWGPRIGFAYRAPRLGDLVVRGGYGIYYIQEVTNTYTNLTLGTPVVKSFSYSGTYTQPINPATAFLGQGSAVTGVFGAAALDPDMSDAYVQQWNLTLQKQLPGKVFYDIGYVGSKGTNLAYSFDGNRPVQIVNPTAPGVAPIADRRPYKGFGSIGTTKSLGNSIYHSLQMKAERRMASGLSFLGAYTWSKALSTQDASTVGGGWYTGNVQDILNLTSEKSPAAFDLRHRFSMAGIYNIPLFATAKNRAMKAMLGGWQVNAIVTEQTGFASTMGGVGDITGTGIGSRVSMVSGQKPDLSRSERSRTRWFNTAAFAVTPMGNWGNATRNPLHLPGLNNIDFAANKYFRFSERANVQFRAEMFNFVNHVNLGAPGTSILTPNTFGVITSGNQGPGATGDQRIIQLGLKFQF